MPEATFKSKILWWQNWSQELKNKKVQKHKNDNLSKFNFWLLEKAFTLLFWCKIVFSHVYNIILGDKGIFHFHEFSDFSDKICSRIVNNQLTES